MKSRGVYETPGGTILYTALRELEMLTLDGEALEMKQSLSAAYARLVYGGKWFCALRESLDAFMSRLTRYVTGSVRLALYKGSIIVAGRISPHTLYREDLASFGATSYNHADATGFINLYGLPTMVENLAHRAAKP
jgi:argininosuccinate synthase